MAWKANTKTIDLNNKQQADAWKQRLIVGCNLSLTPF